MDKFLHLQNGGCDSGLERGAGSALVSLFRPLKSNQPTDTLPTGKKKKN